MLTPELVQARRQKGQLVLVPLGARRQAALALCQELLVAAEAMVGQSRQELDAAWDAITVEPRDLRLKSGLSKLIEDRLAFDVETPLDPVELRQKVFHRATVERKNGSFDRERILTAVGEELGLTAAAIDHALFADLKNAHVVRPKAPGELLPGGVEALIDGYDRAQRQAVLLRATEVVVELRDPDKAALRSLFRKLKFLRLLFEAQTLPGGQTQHQPSARPSSTELADLDAGVTDLEGERQGGGALSHSAKRQSPRPRSSAGALERGLVHLRIDGPFSLFESVTKYGLSLALALPWIEATGEHRITAEVRWGKERLPLRFVVEGPRLRPPDEGPAVPEELTTLVRRLNDKADFDWTVEQADVVLNARNVAIVPDLVFVHRAKKTRVYLELLGYWSREALFKRVELVDEGFLREKVIFCASERMRVSEEVLESPHAAIVTYKGAISVAQLAQKLDELV